ncbi:hypothetical protein COOONC_09227 [Cooperia oncophora]
MATLRCCRASMAFVLEYAAVPSVRRVFVLLYYKDGPCTDVTVEEGKFKNSLFDPLSYLPSVERACRSQRIEKTCEDFIKAYFNNSVDIPNLDLLREKGDKFSMHRLVFLFGCDRVEKECFNDEEELTEHSLNLVRSTFAHVYFEKVLMREVQCFEDFISLLEGIGQAHIPPLRKEIERFICREVISAFKTKYKPGTAEEPVEEKIVSSSS